MQYLLWAGPAGAVFAECFVGFVTICPSPGTDISSSLSQHPSAGGCSVAISSLLPRGTVAALEDEHPQGHWGAELRVLRAFPLLSCLHLSLLMLLHGADSGSSTGRILFPFSPFGWGELRVPGSWSNSLSAQLGKSRCASASPGSGHAAAWEHHTWQDAHSGVGSPGGKLRAGVSPWTLQLYCPQAAHTPWVPKPVCLWWLKAPKACTEEWISALACQ